MRRWPYGALAGLLAGAAGVAVAQLAAAISRPEIVAAVTVGGTVIDATPTPLKEFAIRHFGTNDKLFLLTGIGVGARDLRGRSSASSRSASSWLGLVGAGLFGVIGIARRHHPADVPVHRHRAGHHRRRGAVAVLWLLLKDRRPGAEYGDRRSRSTAVPADRGAGGARARSRSASAAPCSRTPRPARSRSSARRSGCPAPADPGPATVTAPGFYTPANAFYRVDTALTIPQINPDDWSLRIHGMVDKPMTLSLDQLLDRPLIQRDITLNCVSNEVGGPYVGTARWLGAPLAALLREVGVHAGADQVVARSIDGMTIGTPVATIMDGRDAMLVVGMNGAPLPVEHGFPVRMLTPGLYGYVGACKWLIDSS